MVYIENTTIEQEVWIERNDGFGATHKSSYQEGYEDGYASGETHQKNLLTTTAFTENGEYQRENGWSGVTVDVPQTGHTDQELEDAFESGYTSGQTDQKKLLATTAFTENGSYHRENGWSGVTVNIDTASTYNSGYTSGYTDGQGSLSSVTFTANTAVTLSDGGYSAVTVNVPQTGSSIPLSSITLTANTAISVSDKAYTGITVNVDTASTYNDGYNDAMDDIEDGAQTLSVSANGTYNTGLRTEGYLWHEVIVDVPQTGSSAVLGTKTITENGTYSASTDSLDGYSAITVNVQTGSSVTYVEYLETDGSEIAWDTGVKLEDPSEVVYFDFAPLTGTATGDAYFPFLSQQYNDGAWNLAIRTIGGGYNVNNPYQTRFGDAYQMIQYSVGNKNVCVLSNSGATVNGVDYPQQATGLYTVDWNIIINGQKKSDGFMRFPVARYYGFKIMSGETTVIDLKPAFDGNDVPCFYDEVSKTYIYHTGSGTPIAGPIVHYSDYMSGFTDGYASGFTDGYNSGYTDGQDNIIGTFTSMTATTNGVYGSSANPLTSVTVNVDVTKIIPVSSIHHSDIGDGKNYFLDTGIYPTTATTVRVKGVGAGYYPNNGFVYAEVNKSSVSDSDWILSIQKDIDPAYNLLDFSIKSRKRTISDWGEPSVGRQIDITCSDFEIYDNILQTGDTASTVSFTSSGTLKVNVGCWWLKGIQIWEDNALVFDGEAAYDEDGHIGLFDNVSNILVYDPDYTMVYENPVLGNVTLTANGIYNASNFGTEGFSAVTVNVTENYGELIGLYCTNNCQFVLRYKQYLENTSIEFGIRTGGASINITSGATAPYVNRIEVDQNGNVSGNSYSYDGSGGVSTGSGQTSVVLDAFPTKNYMLIDTDTKNTTNVNGLSASTCINHSSTPANNLLLLIDDGYFYGGAINNTGADYQSCIFPHVDSDGNACILGSYGLFYPISGECYPIYKNGNNYYVLMKTQPWNQQ